MAGRPKRRERLAAAGLPVPAGDRPSAPPFPVVHGAYSPSVIEARAEELGIYLKRIAHWLDLERDGVAIAQFLRTEARAQLIANYIARVSTTSGIERVSTRLMEQATAADRLAASLGDRLGLGPKGRAQLVKAINEARQSDVSAVDVVRAGRARLNQRGRVLPAAWRVTAPAEIVEGDAEEQVDDGER